MSQTKEQFACNLKAYRQAVGLSQVKLAEKLDYTGKTVSKWESGIALPPAEVLPRLAAALNIDLNTLFDFRERPSYFLGIDGGGTKTQFALADSYGCIVKTLSLGPCNPTSVGMDAAIAVLHQGIRSVCGTIPTTKISLFAGIAGSGVGNNRQRLLSSLETFQFSCAEVERDGEAIIAAGLGGRNGVIVIMGTGSVVFTMQGESRHRVGGYGHLIGDCFCGSEFGRLCLKAALEQDDGSGPATAMTARVKARLGEDLFMALADVHDGGKAYVGSFAPLFFAACSEGDPLACRLLEEQLEQLVRKLSAALREFPAGTPVVLAGGMTAFSALFLEKLQERITDRYPVEILKNPPVVGALLLAGAPAVKGEWSC